MKSMLLMCLLMLMILQQIPVTAVQAALTTTAGGVATLSLPPQQHLEVAGAGGATATVMLTSEEVDKDKLDKGTCTTERCGENQVHCQVSANYCHILAAANPCWHISDKA